MTFILISFAVCFSFELLLSITLIYRFVKLSKIDKTNEIQEKLRHVYIFERILAVIFDVFQAGLSIAGITATIFVLHSGDKIYWLDMTVRCNLRLFIGINPARILRILRYPRWTIWLLYVISILTASNIIYLFRDSNTIAAHDSKPLYLLASASLLSSVVSQKRLEDHRKSGSEQHKYGYKRLLIVFVIINAATALGVLCGAIVLDAIQLTNSSIDTQIRQSIYLVCTLAQLLCSLAFCLAGIKCQITIPFRALIRGSR